MSAVPFLPHSSVPGKYGSVLKELGVKGSLNMETET